MKGFSNRQKPIVKPRESWQMFALKKNKPTRKVQRASKVKPKQ